MFGTFPLQNCLILCIYTKYVYIYPFRFSGEIPSISINLATDMLSNGLKVITKLAKTAKKSKDLSLKISGRKQPQRDNHGQIGMYDYNTSLEFMKRAVIKLHSDHEKGNKYTLFSKLIQIAVICYKIKSFDVTFSHGSVNNFKPLLNACIPHFFD